MRAVVNENLKTGETSTIHKFERAGLGKAPYQFTGEVTEKSFVAYPGATPKSGSSCDYCGTAITFEFWVVSADGNKFKLGCDCIHKSDDSGLIRQISKAERKLRDKKNIAAHERKMARLRTRLAAAKELLPQVQGYLHSKPHPSPYFAREGKTLLDYVSWCFENRAPEKACFEIELTVKRLRDVGM